MHHLGHTGFGSFVEQEHRAIDVDGAQEGFVFGQRHLGDVVEDEVNTFHRSVHGGAIADIATNEFHSGGPVVGIIQVEYPHIVPSRHQAAHQQRSEVATAAGDQRTSHSSSPCSMHHRILRRMPS